MFEDLKRLIKRQGLEEKISKIWHVRAAIITMVLGVLELIGKGSETLVP